MKGRCTERRMSVHATGDPSCWFSWVPIEMFAARWSASKWQVVTSAPNWAVEHGTSGFFSCFSLPVVVSNGRDNGGLRMTEIEQAWLINKEDCLPTALVVRLEQFVECVWCASMYKQQLLVEMTSDLGTWRAGLSWYTLGQVIRSRSQVKFHSHKSINVAKVIDATSSEGFSSALYLRSCNSDRYSGIKIIWRNYDIFKNNIEGNQVYVESK